jgi:DsbC/DsbD-like thiol-disulfide interchange protein/cytochrome c biogenesis protein CcdA
MLRRLLILVALLIVPALGQARGIEPQMVAEGPVAPGGEVELAIQMKTQPGWHGYWLNPGDAGLPMDEKWQLPPGYSVGPLRYPVPTRLTVAGIMNYVYEKDYAVLVRLKVPQDAKIGMVPILASARWLACTDKICVPEQGEFAAEVAVGIDQPDYQAQFDEWRKLLPRPLATPATFELSRHKLRVAIPLPRTVEVQEPYLFPSVDGPVDYAGVQHFRRVGDQLIADLPRRSGEPAQFAGVVALGDGTGLEFNAVRGTVPKGGQPIGDTSAKAMLWAILGAILGGLLLNLMPCVFPILALKAAHLARAGGEEREARHDALAYAAGAVVGTGALGALLLAIRAGGSAAGWAFQLQDPRTILLLLLLVTAITLNLLRVFELPVLAGGARPAGSFGTGALAAFVATPCAGPFLGVALGTALLLPLAGSIIVFAALGLGLAIPFLLVAFVPALRSRLPKPGPWMARLQRILAIPMALTAAGCLWLLWRLGGADGLLVGVGGIAAVAILSIGYGVAQRGGRAFGLVAVIAMGLAAFALVRALPSPSTTTRAVEGAEPWSQARVAAHLAKGQPVFVYFTADWCLTCKANEVAAIDRDTVRSAFKRAGVRVLAGDWTTGDPAITRFLESRGRAGVPLYLWYEPGKAVEELPQILTPSMLIDRARQSHR